MPSWLAALRAPYTGRGGLGRLDGTANLFGASTRGGGSGIRAGSTTLLPLTIHAANPA